MKKETFLCDAPARLDTFLTTRFGVSRNAVSNLIKNGSVAVNDTAVSRPGCRLKTGDIITVIHPQPQKNPAEYTPEFDIGILFEDEEILVIDKPSGVVVHGAPSVKEATLVDWLKLKGVSLSTISGEERHGIVHRLDKETSGVMVVAKTNRAHTALSDQLQHRTMGRYYLALIDLPLKSDLYVEAPIARNPKNRLKMGVVGGGKTAKSAFVKLQLSNAQKVELIGAKLFTGRTHQIRVHLAHINRHILGDELYGYKQKGSTISRVFLHAYLLYLIHPVTGENLHFKAPLPDDISAYLTNNFNQEAVDETIDTQNLIDLFNRPDFGM